MSAEQRMIKLLTASPEQLKQIDAVLSGEAAAKRNDDQDCRSCTLSEAAARLSVSRPTVYRLIGKGRLKCIDLGGVRRVLLKSIFDFANGNAEG